MYNVCKTNDREIIYESHELMKVDSANHDRTTSPSVMPITVTYVPDYARTTIAP